ncbi:hypothetical protein KJ596_01530 [Patescibacteria group bacterium]|nr:hypothetical protein [Patescibacteria group bacterium]MBU1868085.1 hypothetical protein [Patescibacteria group bacterium]
MRKIYGSFVLSAFVLALACSVSTGVSAQQNQEQNAVQTETQNQGAETQVQVQTQETASEQNVTAAGAQQQVQTARQSVGEAAKQADALYQYQFQGDNESLGEQVKIKAREQEQAHLEIQQQLDKLETRKGIVRWLAGPDYKAIQKLEQLKDGNLLRIQQLNNLKIQTQNQAEETILQNTVQAIEQENTALQEEIQDERETRSLFGWMFRFFAKYF